MSVLIVLSDCFDIVLYRDLHSLVGSSLPDFD